MAIPFAFIRVPKTASMSIDVHLRQIDDYRYINAWEGHHGSRPIQYSAHMRYCDLDYYLKHHPNYIDRYGKITCKLKHCYVFACVRNPWERLISHWIGWQKFSNRKRTFNKWLIEEKQVYSSSLKSNVRNVKQGRLYGRYPMIMPQTSYLTDNGSPYGKLMMDYIVRFESLQEDLKIVSEHIGIDFTDLLHIGRSDQRPAQKCYSKESVDWVYRHFKSDINLFGYEYEGV